MTSLRQRAVVGETLGDLGHRPERDPVTHSPNRWRANGAEQRLLALTRAIEREIVPRLLLANQRPPAVAPPDRVLSGDDVVELGGLLLRHEAGPATSYVEGLRSRGTRVETLFLDLLAPTARHLGDLWCEDLCSFSEVTLGLVRLQQVLRELSPSFHGEVEPRLLNRRALLVPVPGEQHTFGLYMVAEFFRRAGWEVWSVPLVSDDELARIVRRKWFAVVGLSVGSEIRLERLGNGIRAVRRASRNRAVGIMVGGPLFIDQPELSARVGADATAADAREAARQAERMLDVLAVNG